MGAMNSKKPTAEEVKYLSPTGLYPTCNWDLKTIRRLIVEKKLAPFYPGREEKDSTELDECPICFMFYAGGLNRTKCCQKGVCTECFLQIKKPGAPLTDSICPFCNRARFTVIFMGPKSREERMKEDMEEQKVLELQEKVRQEEIERDLERERQKQKERDQDINHGDSRRDTQERARAHTDGPDDGAKRVSSVPKQVSGRSASHASSSSVPVGPQFLPTSPSGSSPEQDLEDLMLMEAIRLSLIDGTSNNAQMGARHERASSSPSPEDSDDDPADDYGWAGVDSADLISDDLGGVSNRPQSRLSAAGSTVTRKDKERGEESEEEGRKRSLEISGRRSSSSSS